MEPENVSNSQKIGRSLLIGSLVLLAAWMLRHFLAALCWAVVLSIATSPLYERWLARFHGKRRHVWAALTFTVLVGILLIAPLTYGGVMAVRQAFALVHSVAEAHREGAEVLPQWLLQVPWIGDWLHQFVTEKLAHAGDVGGAVAGAKPNVVEWTRYVGIEVFRRVVTLAFSLLTLFFVYLHRDQLLADVPAVSRRLFGPTVESLLIRAADAIRATVDGVVIVALVEGAIMGGVYAVAGAPHPILFGAITGIFAMIPFAAPVVFGAVGLILAAEGSVGTGVGVVVAGSVVLFVADHFVRPAIIGGGAKLPFLWVLLGILAGVESFGLVGIFLGPALMAALVSIWRNWVRPE